MRNLEYKTRIEDEKPFIARARSLGADLWGDLRQTDTYFEASRGRLKLRETAGRQGELIAYRRDEHGADRASDYEVARTTEAGQLRDVLAGALGVRAVVRKRRTLLVLDSMRIHLDNVDELGNFLEIEVPVQDDDSRARERLDWLLDRLGLSWEQCVRASYLDLALGAEEKP